MARQLREAAGAAVLVALGIIRITRAALTLALPVIVVAGLVVASRSSAAATGSSSALPHPSAGSDATTSGFTTFDDFSRRVPDGYSWGTASSSDPWFSYANATWCPGYKVSVEGHVGVMKSTDESWQCLSAWTNEGIEQEAGNTGSRPWEGRSFALKGRFEVDSVNDGDAFIYIRTAFPNTSTGVILGFYQSGSYGGGYVGLQGASWAPMVWEPNTWYAFEWVFVYGDQERLKVWPATESEPADWLLASTDPIGSWPQKDFGIRWNSYYLANLSIDDLAFGQVEVHPILPPPPGTESNPPYTNQDDAGDPTSTFTGTYSATHLDVAIPGRGPAVQFARSYNSNDTRVTALGPGWTHSYNIRLTDPGDGTKDVILIGPQGRSDRYVESAGSFTPPTGVHRTLVGNADGTYTTTDKSQTVWQFDGSGRLTQIADRYGNASNLAYNSSGLLRSISDPAGRGLLTLAYTNNLLTSVTDWVSRKVTFQYDTSGRLWKVTDRAGQTTTYAYDGPSPRLASITDARGHTALTVSYDAQGRVARQQDARDLTTGDSTTFAYVVNGDGTRVTTVTGPPTSFEPAFHPTTVDTYDANGWLTTRVAQPSSAESLTEAYTYDSAGDGDRVSVTDPRGNRTDYCYDVDYTGQPIAGSSGNVTRTIAPAPVPGASRPTTLLRWDSHDNLIERIAPRGVPSGASVTCATDLTAVNSAFASDYDYDASGVELLSTTSRFTDPDLGLQTAVTTFEYGDAANPGRITRIVPPRGNTGGSPDYTYATTLAWNASGWGAGRLASETDPLGNTTTFSYDEMGRLMSSVDPLGNAAGGAPADHTTYYTHDSDDRVQEVVMPAPVPGGAPLVTQIRYDEVGNPILRIDATGQVTTYAYDERDALSQVTESASAWTNPASPPAAVITTQYDHDAAGNITRITRAAGDANAEQVTDYAYDGRGLVRSETQHPAWPSTSGSLVTGTTYDPSGNVATLLDPLGRTTTNGYDALNRLISIGYSDAGTPDVAYAYDADGNRVSMIDGTGSTTYVRDELGRMTSVLSPGSSSVGYRYDRDANRTKVIYPDATAVTYTFNKADQLASLADWAARTVGYTYTADGQMLTATYPDASVATYDYDNAGRLADLSAIGSGGGSIDRYHYTYDAVGNVLSRVNVLDPQFARPNGLTGSNGSWSGTYASINEETPNDTTYIASPAGPTTTDYYEVSLFGVQPPAASSDLTFRYRYAKSGNDAGQTTNLTVELRQGSTIIASRAQTNIPGASGSGWQHASLTLTPAQAAAITDFGDLRLRFSPSTTGGGQARSAQISWAQLQVPGPDDPATLVTYGYDHLTRLTSALDSGGSRSYGYDPVGNRVSAGTTTYTYDRTDRMTAAAGASVTVDANGNLTAIGPDTFTFDQANRLTSAAVAGSSETYTYDGDGTRATRQVGGNQATQYVTDPTGALPVTIADGTRKYVYGLGLAYAVTGGSIEIVHPERLGSIRSITDATGAVTATYAYDEWGLLTGSTGSSSLPLGFTGEPTDASGLSYLRARYYDPTLGRFLARDTWAGNPKACQTLNRYVYALNDPTTRIDPSGLKSQVLEIAKKCGNALIQLGLEGASGSSAYMLGTAALAGGEITGPGDLAIAGVALWDLYVSANNFEWTRQSVAYCLGVQSAPPDASDISAPEVPILPIFPGGGLSLPSDIGKVINTLQRLVPTFP
jgi:RHS repeat-associated protein